MTDSRIHEELADIARTLGHAHRLALLEHIAESERPVEQLAELSGLSLANASQHLQQLRRAGLVQTRREGKRVYYRLGTGPVARVLDALRHYAEHNRAEIRALVADSIARPERLEAISRDELLRRIGEDSVVLLDVRPGDEFASGHLPGAINVPLEDLERRLGELPRGKEIIAYCRGPHCVFSTDALELLRARKFSARHFAGGFPEWQAAGLEVEGKRRARRR